MYLICLKTESHFRRFFFSSQRKKEEEKNFHQTRKGSILNPILVAQRENTDLQILNQILKQNMMLDFTRCNDFN